MLTRLDIRQVRNLRSVSLPELGSINVFSGPNGSGKTSILESVHLLGMARSFRGNSVRSLITHGAQDCTVYGRVLPAGKAGGQGLSLGVQRGLQGEVTIKVGGAPVRAVSELAANLPLLVINNSSFDLLTGAPASRRQYLDWGVFHVEHRFLGEWQRFQRCIKQRNMLLRRGKISPAELQVWTRELAEAGEAINLFREQYFRLLESRFQAVVAELVPAMDNLQLRFRRGWDKTLSLADALQAGIRTDSEQGYTHSGPQRADIRVVSGTYLAADTLSRGQQKLVVCALKLAQGQLMVEHSQRGCSYLVDDLPSELDRDHSRLVCQQLAGLGTQVFITGVDGEELLPHWPSGADCRMFHVEHGAVVSQG